MGIYFKIFYLSQRENVNADIKDVFLQGKIAKHLGYSKHLLHL